MAGWPFGEPVKRHRRSQTGRDEYGAPVYVWADAWLLGAVVAPGSGTENDQGRTDTDTQTLTVYLPPGSDVQVTDELTIRGRRYSVSGRPQDYGHSPFTGTPGPIVVTVQLGT